MDPKVIPDIVRNNKGHDSLPLLDVKSIVDNSNGLSFLLSFPEFAFTQHIIGPILPYKRNFGTDLGMGANLANT